MLKLKEKVPVFLFGLTIGLFIGCIFFVFKLDDYFSKMKLPFQQQVKTEIVESTSSKIDDQEEKKENKEKQKKSENTETTSAPESETPSLAVYGSFGSDSTSSANESIKLLKEELISVKNIVVKDLSPSKQVKSAKDSMLAVMSGISEPKANDFFLVEFRKTPLNSKGYKMSRNRLFIYGLNENADISIIKTNDELYLKNNAVIYKLDYTVEFKALEKATDPSLIEKFN